MYKMTFLKKTLLLFSLILTASSLSANTNKMLAVVNDNYVIFEHDLDKEIKFQKIINPKESQAGKDLKLLILNQMITNHLILEDANRFQIKVSYSDVISTIKHIEETDKLLEGSLLSKAKAQGISQNEFYTMLKQVLTVDKMKQVMSFSKAKVSNHEAETELRRVLNLNGKAEMLLYEISISFNNKPQEEAEKKIDIIYNQLKKGENFSALAKKFSEDISASMGGEIGWVPEIFLSSDVIVNIKNLSPNQYTAPFVSGRSYKIILLKNVRPLLYIDVNNQEHLNQLTNYAKQKVMNDKAQVYLEDYLKEIQQKASITIYNENLK